MYRLRYPKDGGWHEHGALAVPCQHHKIEILSPTVYMTSAPSEKSLKKMIDQNKCKQEPILAGEILDMIDNDILHAARNKGRVKQQVEINRDCIASLLELLEEWPRPDEVYADADWEICIIWRSAYGMVEIGTEPDGSVTYFVKRTLVEKRQERQMTGHDTEELRRIFAWLDKNPKNI